MLDRFVNKSRLSIALLALALLAVAGRAAADPAHTLMVYGDSLSAAYGIEESQGWVELLSGKLESEGYPYLVVNGSVSGETTTGGLSRLPAMLDSYRPNLVILELGGNDGLRGLPLNAIRQNLKTMVQLAKDAGAEVLLAGMQIPPNYGPRYTEPFYQQFSDIAEEMDLALIPFLIDGIPQQPELMQNDGIHPKAEAQSMIVDNVWPVLEPLLAK
ncbi:MAG: arylesterase [Gammaproteobacteria bacterium]|nr:arylesterase [Gammaproteobacteria bacterium]